MRVVEPHFPESLVDDEGRAFLCSLARRLPGMGIYVVESRLSGDAQEVDFSIGVTCPESARVLARPPFPPHLSAFLSRWSQSAAELRPVESVWLEFDHAGDVERLPEPVVCARLRGRTGAEYLAGTLFPALVGRALKPSEKKLLQRTVSEIPADGRVLYAFSLLPRGGDALRLELYGLGPEAVAGYLGKVAPSSLLPQVETLLPLVEGCDRYHLSLDLGEGVGPRIGIEAGLVRLPRREPRWGELFDRLVAAGLCNGEKRRGALAWPGYDTRTTAPERWPGNASGYCVRGLSHVKLVSWPDRAPEAKVYLLFQHLEKREDLRRRRPARP